MIYQMCSKIVELENVNLLERFQNVNSENPFTLGDTKFHYS